MKIRINKALTVFLCAALLLLGGCDWLATPPVRGSAEYLPSNMTATATEPDTQTAIEPVSEPINEPITEPQTQIAVEPVTPPEEELHTLRMVSVGDNLIHNTVITAGKKADGSYDFNMLFDGLGDYFAEADLACINQETIFIDNPSKYGGYPAFGTPTMVGDAIVKAGFDIVLHASNHSLDKTSRGVLDTLAYWREHPKVSVLGIYDNFEDTEKLTVLEKNGITIAVFNYTYGMNGYTPPDDKPWMVNVMSEATKPKIKAELQAARELADVVVVYPHWGSEYVYAADSFQKEWAQLFATCGVDIVIGAHPHVLQPMESLQRPDGGNTLVYYSVGNYCSHQDKVPRMLGGSADVTICKQGERIWLESAKLIPLATQIEPNYFTTYFLSDYTDELAKAHKFNGLFGFSKYNPQVLWELYTKVTGFTEDNMDFLTEPMPIGRVDAV